MKTFERNNGEISVKISSKTLMIGERYMSAFSSLK